MAKFEDFLKRSVKPATAHGVLALTTGRTGCPAPMIVGRPQLGLVLIDDPPLLVDKTRERFHNALRRYLHSGDPVRPVVLIVTDLYDSETNIFGPAASDLVHSPACLKLRFNPVADTFLKKALERVVSGEVQARRLRARPTPEQLKCLVDGAAGDVRNAINSLHMLLLEVRPASGRARGTPSGVPAATALPAALLNRYGALLEGGLLVDDTPDACAAASRFVGSSLGKRWDLAIQTLTQSMTHSIRLVVMAVLGPASFEETLGRDAASATFRMAQSVLYARRLQTAEANATSDDRQPLARSPEVSRKRPDEVELLHFSQTKALY